MGFPKKILEKRITHALSEVYCLVSSQLLDRGAIDQLPRFVPRLYANRWLTYKLVIEKMKILSPVLCKFIQSERHLFDVDGRRAVAVALKLRAKSSKPTTTQNGARHMLYKKHAQVQS